MIDKELLDILACPDTKQDLEMAEQALIEKANLKIEKGELLNRSKNKVTQKLDGGLLQKEDKKFIYPIVDQVPVLLVDEAIAIDDIG